MGFRDASGRAGRSSTTGGGPARGIRPAQEQPPLAFVRGHRRGPLELRGRVGAPALPLVEVAAHARHEVVAAQRGHVVELVEQCEPGGRALRPSERERQLLLRRADAARNADP